MSVFYTVVTIIGYSWLVFDLAGSFGGEDGKNKEIFFLSMLPILVGIILKGFDRIIGESFHVNSSDAEKGEVALSILERFERLIRAHLTCDESESEPVTHREAARCASLLVDLYESMDCPVQKKALLVSVRSVFPILRAEGLDLSRLNTFDVWCSSNGALASAMSNSLGSSKMKSK